MKRKQTILFNLTILMSVLLCPVAFSASVQYTYDSINRLIKAEYDNGAVIEYSYDAAGNRTSRVVTAIPACEGDFDGDDDVDGSDLALFAADFGRTDCGSGPPCEGDFDGDGDVDGSDLATFAADFGRTDCH